ncbi:putative manganese transporter [Actibacterium sp.]|uniref:putative manganese transporter n=1 Tax=Actibacterium sp. TaxID=1872125 RepID=UPI0035617C8A
MNTATTTPTRMTGLTAFARFTGPIRPKRAVVVLLYLVLAIVPGDLGALTRSLFTDAFTQVSVFVAATLLLFYGSERLFHFDMGTFLSKSKFWQVPVASLLGATPGCGGAVIVVAAYSSGNVGMGALVATLTATMGDAAFLLIATRPEAALVVLPISLVVGVASGWLVDWLNPMPATNPIGHCEIAPKIGKTRLRDWTYCLIVLPGLIVGGAQLAQIELTHVLGLPITPIACLGVGVGLLIWMVSPVNAMTNPSDAPVTRAAEETSFITVWVLAAYLAYDYAAAYAGLDLHQWFQTIAPLLPLIAIAIGFVPGCGPQVLVCTLYINGAIPFSALIGNAISNDGDALFPAIALSPKAAVVATIYSAIPALVVAYGFYFLAPNFMN